jgi:ParB family chromosome partitioning protein
MENTTVKMDIENIEVDPGQPRKNKPAEYLRELAKSIENEGLKNPIHVRVHPDDSEKYMVVNGECRFTALSMFTSLKEIPVIIRYDLIGASEGEIYLDQIVDNDARKNLDPLETIASYQRSLDLGNSLERTAEALGKSVALIQADLPILQLSPHIQRDFDSGKLPKTVARRLASFEGSKADKAYDWAKKGKDTKGMLAKIDAYIQENAQTKMFDLKEIDADTKKKAGKEWDLLRKAVTKFANSPFSNGKGPVVILARKSSLNELEFTADEMIKMAEKIKADCRAYRAREKSAVA